jgi:hypothetical protein
MKALSSNHTAEAPPGSWKEMEARLQAALRDLPVWHPSEGTERKAIPYETLIPGIARQLAHMRPTDRKNPHGAIASRTTTAKELAAVRKNATALLRTLETLHKPAIEALGYLHPWPKGPRGLETQLRILIAASSAEPSDLPANAGKGVPVKYQARKVARTLAQHYLGLTGKPPTRSVFGNGPAFGPFIYLLKTVYEILGIEVDADGQAREAIEFMKKSRSEEVY